MRVAIGIVLVAAMVAAVILFVFESDDSGPPQDFRDGALSGAGTPASATGPRLPAQPSGPTPAPVAPDSTTADEPKVVEPAGTGPERDERLPRVVSDFRRMPVADARVFVKTTSGETVRYTTDQLGQIPLGEDRIQGESIRIEAPGFTLLDQSLAEGFEGKTFVLSPEAAIRVRVTDAQGLPQPWANLQIGVVIQDEHGAVLGLPWSLEKPPVTDSNGEARLAKLDPRGRYLIVATLARLGVGVAHDVVPDASGPGASVTIKLGGDGVIQVLVTSSTGESIHNARALLSGEPDRLPGRIVADPASRALADLMRAFKVRFRRSTFSYHDARFTGWRSGSGFAFDQLPPGEYVVEIEARGFKPYARKLRVGEGATVQHVAAMELEGVALTGMVMDGAGQPVIGAQLGVNTNGSSYEGYLSAASGSDGSFQIRGPAKWLMPLHLQVTAAGFETSMIRVPPDRKQVSVRLRRMGFLRGEVRMEDRPHGEVVFDFVRSVPQAAQERRIHEVRERWKRFSFTLPSGKWTMRVTAPDHEAYTGSVAIPEGGEVSGLDIRLRKK